MSNRLKVRYNEDIKSALQKELDIKNANNIPSVEKIVISVGAGKEANDKKQLQSIVDTLALISGQKPVVTLTKKAVSNFKTRVGYPVGVKVTLRQEKMYAFLDKLISVTLPRVKDFRGLSAKGFDGRGTYNFGLDEQLVFPEVKFDDVIITHGMNITIVTTTDSDKEAHKLLELIGIPFKKAGK